MNDDPPSHHQKYKWIKMKQLKTEHSYQHECERSWRNRHRKGKHCGMSVSVVQRLLTVCQSAWAACKWHLRAVSRWNKTVMSLRERFLHCLWPAGKDVPVEVFSKVDLTASLPRSVCSSSSFYLTRVNKGLSNNNNNNDDKKRVPP